MTILLATLFILICILLIVVVLLQKGRGGGLGAAFGGMGSSAFGTKIGDVFTWVTIVLTAMFLLLAIITSLVFRPKPERLPEPVFDPKVRPITGPTEVTIRVPRADVKRVEIYYTTDGSTPTKDSKRYRNTAVTVLPGMTLKAIAFLRGWLESPIKVGHYPPLEATTLPAGGFEPLTPGTGPPAPPDETDTKPTSPTTEAE